jgi:hypothetical protein
MFSLLALVCQGLICTSFTPPMTFYTEEQCISAANILFNVVEDAPDQTLKDMKCVSWEQKA